MLHRRQRSAIHDRRGDPLRGQAAGERSAYRTGADDANLSRDRLGHYRPPYFFAEYLGGIHSTWHAA